MVRNRGRNKIELGAGPTEYLRHVAVSRVFRQYPTYPSIMAYNGSLYCTDGTTWRCG